jgi:hypothetical protein
MTCLIAHKPFLRRFSQLRLRYPVAAVRVVVLALSLAACGGSGSTTSAAKPQSALASATTTSFTTSSPTPLTVRAAHTSAKNHRRSKPRPTGSRMTSTTPTRNPTTAPSPKKTDTATSAARTTTTSQTTTPVTTTSQATTTAPTKPVSTTAVDTRPMRATLVGENHAPKVNQPWSYTVTVTDRNGRPLSGTVDIEFALAGQVVGHDKPPTRPVTDGRLNETLKFPTAAVGVPLELQAVVHTTVGSLTLDWSITVQP